MRIDIYHHTVEAAPDPRIDTLVGLVRTLITGVAQMSGTVNTLAAEITQLQADSAAQTTVIQSAETVINGIAGQIAAAVAAAQAQGATPEQLQALTDLHTQLSANTAGLSASIAANTTPPAPATP